MRTILALVLIAAVAGCGGDGGGGGGDGRTETMVDPSGIVIVSGDGQVGAVLQPPSSLRLQQVAGGSVLPDTLVARITGDTSQVSASTSLTGPGLTLAGVTFPAGTSVEYVADPGCGRPYIAAVAPDTAGYVRTLWEVPSGELPEMAWHDGTWGAECHMEARSKVGNQFRADTSFTAIFEPGPLDFRYGSMGGGELRVPQSAVVDAYGNRIPFTVASDCACVEARGTIADYPTVGRELVIVSYGTGSAYIKGEDGETLVAGTLTVWEVEPGTTRIRVDWD